VAVAALTFTDYGLSFDQEWHSLYGRKVISWYRSLFQNEQALTYWNMYHYGALFEASAEAAVKFSPFGRYETRNLLSALWAGLAGVGTYKLAALLGGRRIGVLALLFLLLTPRFYGHGFINNKDIPFATSAVFSLYFIVQAVHTFPRFPKHLVMKIGLAIGAALGIRIGGVILLGYLAFAMGLWLVGRYPPFVARVPASQRLAAAWQLGSRFVAITIIAYLFMLIWWPAAQVRPLGAPLDAVLFTTTFPHPFDTFFDGQAISTALLPWYYLPQWFWITTPEYYFVGLLLAAVCLILAVSSHEWRTRLGVRGLETRVGLATIALAAGFPIAVWVFQSPVDYDGIRHFLFVLPPISVICAFAAGRLIEVVRPLAWRVVLSAGIVLSLAVTAVDLVALHPYQYVYFNRVGAGGVGKAARSYETDYWGLSFKEGAEWMVANCSRDVAKPRPQVATCLHSTSTSYYLPENYFEFVGSVQTGVLLEEDVLPDLFLAHPRWGCDTTFSGKTVHTVEVREAPLLSIIEVSPSDSSSTDASLCGQ
jgi:hypothetical protein